MRHSVAHNVWSRLDNQRLNRHIRSSPAYFVSATIHSGPGPTISLLLINQIGVHNKYPPICLVCLSIHAAQMPTKLHSLLGTDVYQSTVSKATYKLVYKYNHSLCTCTSIIRSLDWFTSSKVSPKGTHCCVGIVYIHPHSVGHILWTSKKSNMSFASFRLRSLFYRTIQFI